jgi:hypothetical protein
MPSSYPARVKERLGPLSREQHDVRQMLAEWVATGSCDDRGRPDGECGICGHQDTRWEFELDNRITGKRIHDGGSTCITKFSEIAVRDSDGTETKDRDRKHAILSKLTSELVREHNQEIALETVVAIRARIPEAEEPPAAGTQVWTNALASVEAALRGEGRGRGGTKVRPKVFNMLLWAARVTGVSVPAAAFRGIISLQGDGIAQMLEYSKKPRVYAALLQVLTPAQRRACAGHRG